MLLSGGYPVYYGTQQNSYPQQGGSGYPQQAGGTPAYRTQNWSGYKMNQNTGFDKGLLDRYASSLFKKYDTDGSGTLTMSEFPRLIYDFCQASNKPCPNINDLHVFPVLPYPQLTGALRKFSTSWLFSTKTETTKSHTTSSTKC